MGLLASRVDLLPILLHADDGPPTLWTFIQPLFELADVGFAIVGKLTFTIVMMDQKSEAGAFTARGKRVVSESAKEIIAGVMKMAVDSGDETLLRKVLNSPDLPREFYVRGETRLSEIWLTYTHRTGDVSRNVELLKSLDYDKFFGERMSAIIPSRKEMSLEERVAWLKEEIPAGSQQLKALEDQYDRSILFDSGTQADALIEGFKERESGPERDFELNAFARSLARLSQYDKALLVLEMISDAEYREAVENDLEPFSHDPFGQ